MQRFRALAAGLLTVSVITLAGCPTHQTSQEKFWISYIEDCNPAAQFNGNAVFLGSTNNIGPGSVWGTTGGTANLDATQQTFLGAPNASGQYAGVNYATTTASCSGQGTRKWDLSLGVPISFANTDLSTAITASNTKTITVAINGVQIDTIPATTFEDAVNKLDKTSPEFLDATDGKHYLMSAGEAVTGLTIKYTLDNAISANIKANIQAKAVTIGTSQNPAQVQVDVDTTGQVITLTATSRAYMLGQFLKLDPITVAGVNNIPEKRVKVAARPAVVQ